MTRSTSPMWLIVMSVLCFLTVGLVAGRSRQGDREDDEKRNVPTAVQNATAKVKRGQHTFRFDTFGDQAFWGGTLKLHEAIEGARFGGVGPGVSPRTALTVGLKVDVDALPRNLLEQIEKGRVNLDDPAVTLALLRLNAVIGLTGEFNASGTLKSVGTKGIGLHRSARSSRTPKAASSMTGVFRRWQQSSITMTPASISG